MLDTFDRIDAAIEKNAELADAFVATGAAMYGFEGPSTGQESCHSGTDEPKTRRVADWEGSVNPHDQEKAHSTVKQLYRDWSAEGAVERKACYGPILDALDREYQHIAKPNRGQIKVLVPGADEKVGERGIE